MKKGRSKKFKMLAIAGFLAVFLSGCSLAKSVIAPLTPVKTTLPQEKSTSTEKFSCAGSLVLFETGDVKSCDKGFKSYDKKFNQVERKLNWREKLGQIISRMSGYLIIGGGLLLFFVPGAFGLIFGRVIEAGTGVGSVVAKKLVQGINKGKKYVRQNGYKLNDEERKSYQQGADDMLKHIADSTADPKMKKVINKYRAESESF